jgi:hypothetical protein
VGSKLGGSTWSQRERVGSEGGVGLQVKRSAFPVCFRPSFREPSNVETRVEVVSDSVAGIGDG